MKKKILKHVLSMASGVIGLKNPVVGLIIGSATGIKDQIVKFKKKNKESDVAGEGNVDYSGIIGSVVGGVVVLVSLYMLLTGHISIEQFIEMN